MRRIVVPMILAVVLSASAAGAGEGPGHSEHGSAFDSGLRQRGTLT